MDDKLHDLRNLNEKNYLSAKIASGKGKLTLHDVNYRGFVAALDYRTNGTMGYMNPAGGDLVTTHSPTLDRITANYQYMQFGHEVNNENLANSKAGMHVGASAKSLAAMKELDRQMEAEEWYFCRGDGSQIIADITSGVSIAALATGTLTMSGSRDGAGAWMLRVGQVIRIYDVTLTTLKSVCTVTAKTSNTAVSIIPVTALTSGNAVVDTDVVLPQGDGTATPTTTGVKGIIYMTTRTTGNYFDKSLSTVPALQPIVDASTTTPSRTTMEYLYRRHNSIRNNGQARTRACVSPAQMSNYFTQFYAQNTAHVNIIGDKRPQVDFGAANPEYTHWGQPIEEYKFLHPKYWHNLDFSSFYRLSLKDASAMLTPAGEYVQKIVGGAYANSQQRWSDTYFEYFSPNPAQNSAFTALTFSGLPLLKDDSFTG